MKMIYVAEEIVIQRASKGGLFVTLEPDARPDLAIRSRSD